MKKVRSRETPIEVIREAPGFKKFRDDMKRLNADFETKLFPIFETYPIEDGMVHPAEEQIEKFIKDYDLIFRDWLEELIEQENEYIYDILRCVGRVIFNSEWKYDLMKIALNSNHISIRDAAVRSFENWGGQESINILSEHREESSWLNDYIRKVIENLKES